MIRNLFKKIAPVFSDVKKLNIKRNSVKTSLRMGFAVMVKNADLHMAFIK